jgi:hypothetical protein
MMAKGKKGRQNAVALCGFGTTQERDMYMYNLWCGWRGAQGQDTRRAPREGDDRRFAQYAATADVTYATHTGQWAFARLRPFLRTEQAWRDLLALARSWLEPDYSVGTLQEFIARLMKERA